MGEILRRTASRLPNKPALVMGEQSLTYDQFNRRVNRLASALLEMGLNKGDRVAVLTHNCIEYYEIYLALCKAGGVHCPINNLLRPRELQQLAAYIRPRFMIYDAEFSGAVQAVFAAEDGPEFFIRINGDSSAPGQDYEKLMAGGNEAEPEVEVRGDDVMSIFLTSGTTGRPKGAVRTHHHNCLNAYAAAVEVGLAPDDRVLLLFPFYHITYEDRFCHLLVGNTIVIRREGNFRPAEVLDLLAKHRITLCQFVPTMINSMLAEKDIESYDLSSLRLIMYAAAPMPVELLKRALARFKCKFIQFYGQTETGPLTTILRPEDHRLEGSPAELEKLASCGRPAIDFDARVVDREGRDVPIGEVGELVVRGEAVTRGYWELPEETAATIKNGWLHTGDFARMDDEGYFYIVDRKNDMIISGGKNIYPREVEEVLYQHQAVLEATVIGVPDEHWGESVKAIVVLKDGEQAEEQELIDLCKSTLASYKKPRTVEFWDTLPKSSTGKILKRVIREPFWKDRSRKV
jgi:acyl-CoA synthetase (AMP-forming)/AMP-acid ligase II